MITEILPPGSPNIIHEHGKAWRVNLDAPAFNRPGGPPRELSICAWLVYAPWAHPIWHSYALMCISLRALPNWKPAVIHMQGATHELMLYAMDPDKPMRVDQIPALLHPANFCGQFTEENDDAAANRVGQSVHEILRGELSPDTDFMHQWVARYSGSNLKPSALTPDHMIVTEGHTTVVGTGAGITRALESMAPNKPKEH